MKFHEKLYTLRRSADMTQTDLAEKLNVSRQAVSRWEMGTAMPDVDNLIAISDLFGVTLDDLLKNREDAPEGGSPGPKEQAPRYWDCLPKRWWILPALAVALRVLAYVWELIFILFPNVLSSAGTAVSSNSFVAALRMLSSVPGMILLSVILLGLTAVCFLWALVKWLKLRK